MADEVDVEAAKGGNKDLVRRDLRNANLVDMDLSGRDLTGAHLEHANLQGAILKGATLSGAHLMKANLTDADLSSVIAPSTVFYSTVLAGAKMNGASLSASHFTKTDFRGADLRGANFRSARIQDGCDFTNCIIDETTVFDGAHILRPLARDPAFRFYEVERGVLVRKHQESGLSGRVSTQDEQPTQHHVELEKLVTDILEALAPLKPVQADVPVVAGMGHNNPPEPTPLERLEYDELSASLSEMVVELRQGDVRSDTIVKVTERSTRASEKIVAWVARKADLAADECFKQFGKSLADWRFLTAGWLMVSGKLAGLLDALQTYVRS